MVTEKRIDDGSREETILYITEYGTETLDRERAVEIEKLEHEEREIEREYLEKVNKISIEIAKKRGTKGIVVKDPNTLRYRHIDFRSGKEELLAKK